MKKFFALILLLFPFFLSAQVYNMSTTTVSTCSGNFYDSGGSAGNYGNSQNLTMTFTSSSGSRLTFAFNSFVIETCCDRMYIYDGPTTAYPLIGTYTTSPGTFTSTGTSVTFVFTSDVSQTYSGWDATISCAGPALSVYNMSNTTVTACSGAFFDNGGANANYTDNQDLTETFCSGTSDHLQFTFLNNACNIAYGDSLFVYDGANTSAPPLAVFVNGSYLESFISSGTCITFRFKSNATGNASGWAGSFQCTTASPAPNNFSMSAGVRYVCDGGFYDSGGSGGNYSNNENRTETFTSYNGNRLSMAFSSFNLETCCDRLYIYDGPTTAYPLIGTYVTNPGTITSTGSSLTFVFTSDNGNSYSGWGATISCSTPVLTVYNMTNTTVTACSGAFFDNGGSHANYSDNLDIVETFCSGTSDHLQFTFLNNAFNIAYGDSLFVYDGANTSAPPLAIYVNGSYLEDFISSGTCITFRFKSNATGNAIGWAGSFQCTTAAPSPTSFSMSAGVRYVCDGGFYDSGGSGGNYSNNENRIETFTSYNGNRITMNFSSFNIETCCDRLYIYDGPTTAYPLIGTYTSNPGIITSTGSSLTFQFSSDNGNSYSGWGATISCSTPVLTVYNMTNTTVTACSGAFFDNGGSHANYGDNLDIVETFCSGTSDHLQFSFLNNAFNIAYGDTLFVYDGANTSAPPLATYVNGSYLETFISSGTCVTFRFKSNASGNAIGWAGSFQCTTSAPTPNSFGMSGGVRYVCDGYFYDSGGSGGNYSNNENRTETFTSYNGNRISMNFSAFNIETCCERLYIYDGPSTSYPLIGVYTWNPGVITSTGSSLTFQFTSDGSSTYSGWAAAISCSTPVLPVYTMSSGTVTVCDGVFYDNGGPTASYPNNENRVMTFTSASGQYLKFDFNPNHFNIVTGDSLFVYDGASTSAPLFAVLTGGTSPGSLTSNTSSFTFRFKSNASSVNVGWQAVISCVSAPDNNPVINMSAGIRYTCGGTFYDAGGAGNNYPDNDYRTMTFYSNSGCGIRFAFNYFNTESCCDALYVYDGPSTASPLLATLAGSGAPVVQSTGNVLTFRFASDGSQTYNGWSATISCPSQPLATVAANGPTTICSGDTVILTAAPNTSYLWNTGATTQSIAVTTSGSYWVTVWNASNCTATSTITSVTVNPAPTPAITASGPSTFCQGGNVTLTASGGNTYLWSNNSTSNAITVSQGGNYTVTATGANGCTATSAPFAVTVNPTPAPVISASGPLSICSGDNVTLSTSGGGTYLWSNNATTSSITVNQSGTYGVDVTNSFGCTGSATPVTVTVNTIPVATATANGPTTFCQGGSVQLTASGGNSYTWSNNSTGSTLNVTQSGNYYVIAANGGCTDTSAVISVTVNPSPSPVISASGPLSFCTGGSVTLSTSGGTYLWSTNATTSSITVNQSGTYGVDVTNGFGCTAAATPVTVNVLALPNATITAGGPTTFCQGDNVLLTANGGSSYTWSNNSTAGSLLVTQNGTYYVIASNGSCVDTSSSVTVNVLPLPTVTLVLAQDTFCANAQTATLSGGSPAGGTYSGPGVSGGQFTPAIAGVGTHTITYSYTDGNGCSNTSTQNIVVDVCSGVATVSAEGDFSVYPNPATDQVLVRFGNSNSFTEIRLLDVTGRVLQEWNTEGQSQLTLSLRAFPAGVYVLQANGAQVETIRIVKE